jgi:hypothetical protein
MKLLVEIIISLIFHPLAMLLAWINILTRRDLPPARKAIWIIITFIWGIGPILYIAVEDGSLW